MGRQVAVSQKPVNEREGKTAKITGRKVEKQRRRNMLKENELDATKYSETVQ